MSHRPTSVTSLSILVLGDTTRPEFRDTRACLDRWGAVAEYSDADSAAAALSEDCFSPDVIVVAQAFPGQFSHQTVDRLRRSAPLARVVGLMGSWCEGEMRSGSPWPATVRMYWHQWLAHGDRQLRLLAMGQPCSWALPLTATDEERLLVDAADATKQVGVAVALPPPLAADQGRQCNCHPNKRVPSSGTLVAIRSHARETADWLSAACRSHGFATIWQRDAMPTPVERAAAAVFDGTDLCNEERDTLRRFVIALRPAPVIALLSFPRIEDYDRALSAGASVALSKPLVVEDLLEAVDRSITAENAS